MKALNKCPHCDKSFEKLNKHITEKHPKIMEEQFAKIKKLYESGMAARKISAVEGIIVSTSSIVRYLRTQYSKDELEKNRCSHIGESVQTLYDTGEFDFVKEINGERSKTPEAKLKNSEGVKRAYEEGRKVAWTLGKTKYTSTKVAAMGEKLSNILSEKATAGELKTLFPKGEEHPKWIDGRSKDAPNNRPEDFSKGDRNAIKRRANFRCEKCKKSEVMITNERTALNLPRWFLECDHKIPIYKGGVRDIEQNAQALCTRCHYEKTLIDSGALEGRYDPMYGATDHAILANMVGGVVEDNVVKVEGQNIEILDLRRDYSKDYAYKKHLSDKPIFFFSDEWNQKRDICISMINHRLGRTPNKIHARECEVVEIKGNEAKEFFLANHISGHVVGNLYLGLKHKGILVSAASFRRPFAKQGVGVVELARFCSLLDYSVSGGFGKILAVAKEKLKSVGYTRLLSYADLRFGIGGVYKNAGFEFIGHTGLSYGYTNGFSKFNRFRYKAQPGKTEKQVVAAAGVFPYYGCGNNSYRLAL